MLFSTFLFIFGFLPAAIALACIANAFGVRFYLATLALVSIFFYGYNYPIYVLLLLFSALFNFYFSSFLFGKRRKSVLALIIATDLAVLAVFKYADFIGENVFHVFGGDWGRLNIVLPLAISFITFEQIAFATDVYSRRQARGDLLSYLSFITFFPKLIAGPIIRYSQLGPQILRGVKLSSANLVTGLCIFSVGLFKKVAIADSVAPFVDKAYAALGLGEPVAQLDGIMALAGYTLQIYFDFSGYSDMAIGLAWIFGYRLPLNFDSPYKSASIIEFWRRWHMTLSGFLRDYLYFPLGGGRRGEPRRYINLFVVMLLGGLWHGAGWTFVLWGMLHGAALIVNHLYRSMKQAGYRLLRPFENRLVATALTLLTVVIAWNFFRAPSFGVAMDMIATIVFPSQIAPSATAVHAALIVVGFALCLFAPNSAQIFGYRQYSEDIDWSDVPAVPTPCFRRVALAALLFVTSAFLMTRGEPNAFIYFQF